MSDPPNNAESANDTASDAKPHGVVYIVDDDEASREAVSRLVDEMGVPSQTFGSAEKFLAAYDGHRPACLVTDVRMLRMSGLELQEALASRGVHMATVILTAYADTPVTVRAIKNGAITLLEKPCRDLELWDAIREALAQDTAAWVDDQKRAEQAQRLASLSPSELEVLDLVMDGAPNKSIAAKLDCSIRTVEVRRQSIHSKMGTSSLAELVRQVIEAREK
ncbi:MAG: response regulator [Planctomycetota bacterium]